MSTVFAEVPLLIDSPGAGRLVSADVPPLELLALIEQADQNGAQNFTGCAWDGKKAESLPEFASRICSLAPDTVVLWANTFQWPAASAIAAALNALDRVPPQVQISGPLPQSFSMGRTDFALAGASHALACLTASRLETWPRTELAFSLSPTGGFPLYCQPHPWNLPLNAGPVIGYSKDAIAELARALGRSGRPVLAAREPPHGWTRDGLETLGEIALLALREHDRMVRFHLRATPAELLMPGILPGLVLLGIERLEVLAGATSGSTLRLGSSTASANLSEHCSLEIARAGLARETELVFVLGTPGETVWEAMRIVQAGVRMAVTAGVPRIRFEWWYNLPASPLYRGTTNWENFLRDAQPAWFVNPDLWSQVSTELTGQHRSSIREAIEFSRLLYSDLQIAGPELVFAPGMGRSE